MLSCKLFIPPSKVNTPRPVVTKRDLQDISHDVRVLCLFNLLHCDQKNLVADMNVVPTSLHTLSLCKLLHWSDAESYVAVIDENDNTQCTHQKQTPSALPISLWALLGLGSSAIDEPYDNVVVDWNSLDFTVSEKDVVSNVCINEPGHSVLDGLPLVNCLTDASLTNICPIDDLDLDCSITNIEHKPKSDFNDFEQFSTLEVETKLLTFESDCNLETCGSCDGFPSSPILSNCADAVSSNSECFDLSNLKNIILTTLGHHLLKIVKIDVETLLYCPECSDVYSATNLGEVEEYFLKREREINYYLSQFADGTAVTQQCSLVSNCLDETAVAQHCPLVSNCLNETADATL